MGGDSTVIMVDQLLRTVTFSLLQAAVTGAVFALYAAALIWWFRK